MKATLSLLLVLMLLGIVGAMDAEEGQRQEDEYCSMVALWNADAKRGVRKEDRAGWPPFKGSEVRCEAK